MGQELSRDPAITGTVPGSEVPSDIAPDIKGGLEATPPADQDHHDKGKDILERLTPQVRQEAETIKNNFSKVGNYIVDKLHWAKDKGQETLTTRKGKIGAAIGATALAFGIKSMRTKHKEPENLIEKTQSKITDISRGARSFRRTG